MKIKSINSWIDSEIKQLKEVTKKSKKWFSIFAIINIFINIITIVIASIAIDLLLVNTKNNITSGVILASLSAATIIFLFLLNSFIYIYRSIMKAKYYKEAIYKIELEVLKYKTNHKKYRSKDKDKDLKNKIERIKKNALRKKRYKSIRSLISKSFLGGIDA